MNIKEALERKRDRFHSFILEIFRDPSCIRWLNPENRKWFAPMALASEYECTADEAALKIYAYAKVRIDEAKTIEDKAVALDVIKEILQKQVCIMRTENGLLTFAINEGFVKELNLKPREIKAPKKESPSYIDVEKLKTRKPIGKERSLHKTVISIKGADERFYCAKKDEILSRLKEGEDYYLAGKKTREAIFLTSSGHEKIFDIVAELLGVETPIEIEIQFFEDIRLNDAVLAIKGTNQSFYNGRRKSILSQLEEGPDYYYLSNLSSGYNPIILTLSGQEKLPAIVAKELETYASYKPAKDKDETLRGAVIALDGTDGSFYNNRKDVILSRLKEGEDYYLSGGEVQAVTYVTSAGKEKLPAIVAEELVLYNPHKVKRVTEGKSADPISR